MVIRGYIGFDLLQAESSSLLNLLGGALLATGAALVMALFFHGQEVTELASAVGSQAFLMTAK